MEIVYFLTGLVFLIVGAEALVRGASRMAAAFGIAPLIIGLTVVAFGTSSPELAVSVQSAVSGQAGVAVGNVIGSNIFNVLGIIGLSALFVPLMVSAPVIRRDIPLLILVSLFIVLLGLDTRLSRIDGLLLLLIFLVYLRHLIRGGIRESQRAGKHDTKAEKPERLAKSAWVLNAAMVVAGLALLILGSHLLVDGATQFARHLGVSELVIGLTIVAVGTSLPELVTSVLAAVRGERDIAVGNIVGSNLFNSTVVLGVSSVIPQEGISLAASVVRFDFPVMTGVAIVCLPLFFTGGIISRREGVLLLGYYVAYTAYLYLASTHHDSLPGFSFAMLYVLLPLTAVFLGVVALRDILRRRRGSR